MSPIGIFDSGIGGLGIGQAIRSLLPNEDILYIADSKNCPYGTKPTEEIINLSVANADHLINQAQAKMIVVACNTATVSAITTLRSTYPTIPFIGVVPVVKTAVAESKIKSIVVLSTPATIQSQAYQDLLNEHTSGVKVTSIPCPGLAEAIEQNRPKEEIKQIITESIKPFSINYDVCVLGCTHYTLIEPIIKEVIANKILLDSNGAVARHVKRVLEKENLLTNAGGSITILTSGDPATIQPIVTNLFPSVQVKKLTS